jgi:hypothetical protein
MMTAAKARRMIAAVAEGKTAVNDVFFIGWS